MQRREIRFDADRPGEQACSFIGLLLMEQKHPEQVKRTNMIGLRRQDDFIEAPRIAGLSLLMKRQRGLERLLDWIQRLIFRFGTKSTCLLHVPAHHLRHALPPQALSCISPRRTRGSIAHARENLF